MASPANKRIFFLVFCLASVAQGMYSTYFVSILTTIERIYQIQSKTAGAIMSATELGQILGSLLIAYYGGKGNKPKWIAACMTLTAIAALISTSPHFLLKSSTVSSSSVISAPYLTSDLSSDSLLLTSSSSSSSGSSSSSLSTVSSTPSLTASSLAHKIILPTQDQLCYLNTLEPLVLNSTVGTNLQAPSVQINSSTYRQESFGFVLVIFFLCLLAIGFGSTAITTLGIPYIDDIVTKEESPLYLGLTIGLRIFGPALGFLLGSFCIRLDVNLLTFSNQDELYLRLPQNNSYMTGIGAWWLGLIIISMPLLILALPMYYLSRLVEPDNEVKNDFEDITYQAAEDHDIGGSTDFQPHILTMGDLDVTSDRTCYSEMDSSSREVLQAKSTSSQYHYNFGKNIALEQPIITKDSIMNGPKDETDNWRTSCVVVNHFGGLESTSFTNDDAKSLHSAYTSSSTASSEDSTLNLSSSLSRLLNNKLLLLRIASGILHILPIAGFYTFFPKYLIEQFRIAPSSASAISGLAGILFVGLGAFLGGTIIRVLNVNSRLMTRWIASSALLYVVGMLILMNLGCPQNQTVYYESNDFTSTDCLTTCRCSNTIYSPVCANGTTYLSPCLAGCKSYTISEDKIVFDECGCSDPQSSSRTDSSTHHLNLNVATQGHCLFECDNLKWYIVVFSIFTLIHASCEVGSMMFNLRCVKSNDRTLALGLITFSSSLLGTIPCSVIYGTVIDLTCIYWDTITYPGVSPGDIPMRGACRAYKNETFRYYLHGVTAFVMFLAFLVDCLIIRRSKEVDFYETSDSNNNNNAGADVGLKKSTETI